MTGKVSTINVIEVPLFNGTIEDATSYIIDATTHNTKNSLCISATGAHGMVVSQKDASFSQMLNEFCINLPDGMPGVWVGRIKGAKKIARCYGPDFFKHVLVETSNKQINHYFCGGKEGVADTLKNVCQTKFNNRKVVATFSPPFRDMTEIELMNLSKDIEEKQTDILWIGISTPKQEKFAYRISKFCKVHFIITVGAAFDFHVGNVTQAPKLMQRIGLEWLFRLLIEPKRLWKRYIEIVPLFIYYNILELLTINKNKKLI